MKRALSLLSLCGLLAAMLMSHGALAQGYQTNPTGAQAPPPDNIVRRPEAPLALLPNGSFETNGGVNTSVFANWTVVDQAGGSGSWRVQTGAVSPTNGFPVNPPTQGSFAAMIDQGGPGAHVMYQTVTIPPGGARLSFDLFIGNRAGAGFVIPPGGSLDYTVFPNQQFRADLMDPAATNFDVGAGVVQNLYQTRPGDPQISGYTTIVRNIPGTGSTRTLRLRFAETDNQGNFNVGIDNVILDRVGLSLTKTVGTTPGVCAATDAISVTIGTPVYYCFQATNTGEVALNVHDLVDSQLGTVLNDFPFALAPGASSPQVIVPATPTATVTNTATWTAVSALPSYTADATIPVNFQDIAATGTLFALTDDSVSAALPIGFSFSFYGQANTSAYVSSNGFMTFTPGSPNGCCTGQAIPSTTDPDNLIAGWWEDLNPDAGGTFHYQTVGVAPNRVFIAQMTNVQHYLSGNPVTLQYKLFEGSNVVEVHYLAAPSDGGTHSAGIENADGTAGIQFFLGAAALPTPEAVRYAPTLIQTAAATDTATVTVLIPNINVSPLSLSATAPVNQSTTAPLTIANTGQGNLNWAIAEEPAGQPQTTPAARGSASDARDQISEADLKPASPRAATPHTGPIWRVPNAVLFNNGPLITNPGAGAGGANVSALQTALGLGTFGFGHQAAAGNRVADDFVVGGAGWLINTVTFFSYQTNSTTTSTHTSVNVRIWNGVPGAPGSLVVFGDTTTNRLVSSTYTNINRTLDTALTDGARPIMANVVAINTFLPAGTYWFDWQTGGTLASGPWAPPVSIAGQTGKPGANARQFTGAWAAVTDATFAQDFPFVIDGLADCASPADVPWLSLSQTSGTNVGGTNTAITASFNATGLAVGTYNARLCATSNDPTPPPGNGTGLVVVPVSFAVTPSADLVMALTAAPEPVIAGTNLVYTATVNNVGPTAADNVSFSLPLPAGTTFVSATPTAGGVCSGTTTVTCTWAGSTAVAASVSATVAVLVGSGQTANLSATATATSATFDPVLANNVATAASTVQVQSDLSITLTDAPDPVIAGQQLTYTSVLTNLGPSDATGVTTSMALPANTSFVSASITGGSCAGSPVVCTVSGSMLPNTSRTISIVVLVAASAPEGSTITGTITATSASPDPVAANNSATTTTAVITRADLQIGLSASVSQTLINVPVTFTATSLNLGPSDAQNVSITVTLTPDFRYSSHSAAGATCTVPQVGTTGAIVCTWAGATAPGVTRTLTVVAFSNVEGPTVVNASTTSNTTDPVPGNNSASVTVQVGYLVEEIPTLGNLGLLLMGLMIALVGFVAVRRQA